MCREIMVEKRIIWHIALCDESRRVKIKFKLTSKAKRRHVKQNKTKSRIEKIEEEKNDEDDDVENEGISMRIN